MCALVELLEACQEGLDGALEVFACAEPYFHLPVDAALVGQSPPLIRHVDALGRVGASAVPELAGASLELFLGGGHADVVGRLPDVWRLTLDLPGELCGAGDARRLRHAADAEASQLAACGAQCYYKQCREGQEKSFHRFCRYTICDTK